MIDVGPTFSKLGVISLPPVDNKKRIKEKPRVALRVRGCCGCVFFFATRVVVPRFFIRASDFKAPRVSQRFTGKGEIREKTTAPDKRAREKRWDLRRGRRIIACTARRALFFLPLPDLFFPKDERIDVNGKISQRISLVDVFMSSGWSSFFLYTLGWSSTNCD